MVVDRKQASGRRRGTLGVTVALGTVPRHVGRLLHCARGTVLHELNDARGTHDASLPDIHDADRSRAVAVLVTETGGAPPVRRRRGPITHLAGASAPAESEDP